MVRNLTEQEPKKAMPDVDLWIPNHFDVSFEERKLFSHLRSYKPVAHRQIRLADVLHLAHTAFCRIPNTCQHLKMARFLHKDLGLRLLWKTRALATLNLSSHWDKNCLHGVAIAL